MKMQVLIRLIWQPQRAPHAAGSGVSGFEYFGWDDPLPAPPILFCTRPMGLRISRKICSLAPMQNYFAARDALYPMRLKALLAAVCCALGRHYFWVNLFPNMGTARAKRRYQPAEKESVQREQLA